MAKTRIVGDGREHHNPGDSMRTRISSWLFTVLVVTGCTANDPNESISTQAVSTGDPLAGISAADFAAAPDPFSSDEKINTGLGPILNNTSFGRCHTLGGIGGAGLQAFRHFGAFV